MKHIRTLVLILCACFVSVAWSQEPVGKCYNSWAEFHRYNMQRWNRCEKVLTVNNVGGLGLKWSSRFFISVYSSPAVANGVVYVGSGDHKVYALKAKTGHKLWSYASGSYVESSPAVANGVVYVGSEFPDGNVNALNASTGALLWSYYTADYAGSSPAVANGVVYVGSDYGDVYAFGLK